MNGSIYDLKYHGKPKPEEEFEGLKDGLLSKIYFNAYGELSIMVRYSTSEGYKEVIIFFDEAGEKKLADFFKKNIKIQLERPEVYEKRGAEFEESESAFDANID